MHATKDKVVSINYTLTDEQGNTLDSSQGREPFAYLHGASNIVPGLENALEGKSAGERLSVTVEPEAAYGEHDPGLVQPVPRDRFPPGADVQSGAQFQAHTEAGPRSIRVVDVQGDTVTIDANHPLAGKSLNFDVEVVDVRDARPEELQHGHAHGEGGHAH